jgi:hypothetical protein
MLPIKVTFKHMKPNYNKDNNMELILRPFKI